MELMIQKIHGIQSANIDNFIITLNKKGQPHITDHIYSSFKAIIIHTTNILSTVDYISGDLAVE